MAYTTFVKTETLLDKIVKWEEELQIEIETEEFIKYIKKTYEPSCVFA